MNKVMDKVHSISSDRLYIEVTTEDIVYKKDTLQDLIIRVFKPNNVNPSDKRGAIIFYFGGGFVKENLNHFFRQCEYFAHLGYVCFTPNYRITMREDIYLEDCFQDAHDALHYIVNHHGEFGIDEHKIILAGGSAGGALALDCALDAEDINGTIQGAVLFNPKIFYRKEPSVIVKINENTESINGDIVKTDAISNCAKHYGPIFEKNPSLFSAYHKCHDHQPPILIFQGTYDSIAYCDVILFEEQCFSLDQKCSVVYYEAQKHGFFNWKHSGDNALYYDTLKRMSDFVKQHI